MNFLRKFKNLDNEKKFFRVYTGCAAGIYLFMVGGLYAGNFLHKEEIENGTYKKLSHLEIQHNSSITGLSWPFAMWHFFNDEVKNEFSE